MQNQIPFGGKIYEKSIIGNSRRYAQGEEQGRYFHNIPTVAHYACYQEKDREE